MLEQKETASLAMHQAAAAMGANHPGYLTTSPINLSSEPFSSSDLYHLASISTKDDQRTRLLERARLAESTDASRVDAFLAHLHRGGTYKYLYDKNNKTSRWYDRKRPKVQENKDRYFGVHPCRDIPPTNSKGQKKPPQYVRSQTAFISAINCVYSEFDGKDFITNTADEISGRAALIRAEHPDLPEDVATKQAKEALTQGKLQHGLIQYKALALQHIKTLDPPPSVVIDSGGGFHCYWLINDPFYTVTTESRERARKLQAAWVGLVGGDENAKDLTRVLRLPGTCNTKYDPPQPVEFFHCELERTYTFEQLNAFIQGDNVTLNNDVKSSRARETVHNTNNDNIMICIMESTENSTRHTTPATSDREQKLRALDALSASRADSYSGWLQIGMACHHDGDLTFADWERFSRQSTKFNDPGNESLMAGKWETFTAGRGLTFNTIFKFAHIDAPGWHLVGNVATPAVEAALAVAVPDLPEVLPDYISICRKWSWYSRRHAPDETGGHQLSCGNTRVCDYCARRKAVTVASWVERALRAGSTVHVAPAKVTRSLCRKWGKEHYRRFPLDDGGFILINDRGFGDEIKPGEIPELSYWTDLVRSIPAGKRITGTLGESEEEATARTQRRKDAPEAEEAGTLVLRKEIVSNAPAKVMRGIYAQAVKDNWHIIEALPLKTPEDVSRLYEIITDGVKNLLAINGYTVEHQITKSIHVELRLISLWQDSYIATKRHDPTTTPATGSAKRPKPGAAGDER